LFLVVSTSAIDWLERLISEMIYYVSSGMFNPTHSLTTDFQLAYIFVLFIGYDGFPQ